MNADAILHVASHEISSGGDETAQAYRLIARGELDMASAPILSEAFATLVGNGATLVVLDATDVEFLDSYGLRAIIAAGNSLSALGGQLLIEGMSGAVRRVLEISGLLERYRTQTENSSTRSSPAE